MHDTFAAEQGKVAAVKYQSGARNAAVTHQSWAIARIK